MMVKLKSSANLRPRYAFYQAHDSRKAVDIVMVLRSPIYNHVTNMAPMAQVGNHARSQQAKNNFTMRKRNAPSLA